MNGGTTMIIITSDDDIIRQFSSEKPKNTQIINLNDMKQTPSNQTIENNIINLSFLAELSEPNSNNAQVHKRALDSSDQNPSKPVKASKKSTDLICVICGDHGIGYNYNAITCAPCKIFFRRNAFQDLENIRCLTGQYQCSVAHETRRKCTRCRLERCFAMGMRKDFILTEEEKQRRKKRLDQNRNPTSVSVIQAIDESVNINQTIDVSLNMLAMEDLITIENVRLLFISIFDNDGEQCSCVDVSDLTVAFITWSQFIQQVALRFVDFFRQIDEFQNLHIDDRLILIKNNLFLVFPISKCYHYGLVDDCCSFGDNEAAARQRRLYSLFGDSNGFRDIFVHLILSLVEITKQDPTTLSLLALILILSPGLSMNEDESLLRDPLAVNRVQSYYTRLLWNYLVNQWNEPQACQYFIQLLTLIFRIQLIARNFRDFFRLQYITSNMMDRIAPLMQSVLHIS